MISIGVIYLVACKTTQTTVKVAEEAIKAVVAAETEAYYRQDF